MSKTEPGKWSDVYDALWQRIRTDAASIRLGDRAWPHTNATNYDGTQLGDGVYLHVGLRQDVLGERFGNLRCPFVEFYTDHPASSAWQDLVARAGVDGGPVEGTLIQPAAGKAARILVVREPPLAMAEASSALGELIPWFEATARSFREYWKPPAPTWEFDAPRVAQAAARAAREYGATTGVDQTYLKPATLLTIDGLLPPVLPRGKDAYWLAVNSMDRDSDRKDLVDRLHRDRIWIERYEVLVDFHLFQGSVFPYTSILTAESEGYRPAVNALCQMPVPTHDRDWRDNGLMWDAWKLLLVPSHRRMFTTVATSAQWAHLLAHFSALLKRQALGTHVSSDFALVAYDPGGTVGASVRVAVWPMGRWASDPAVATAPLAVGGTG